MRGWFRVVLGRFAGREQLTLGRCDDAGQDRLGERTEPELGAHVAGGTGVAVGDLLVALAEVALFLQHAQPIVNEVYVLWQHALTKQRGTIKERSFVAVGHSIVEHADVVQPARVAIDAICISEQLQRLFVLILLRQPDGLFSQSCRLRIQRRRRLRRPETLR